MDSNTFLKYIAGAIFVLAAISCLVIFTFDNIVGKPVDPSVTSLMALVIGTAATTLGVNIGTHASDATSERVATAVIKANGHGVEVANALSPSTPPDLPGNAPGITLPVSTDNPLAGPA